MGWLLRYWEDIASDLSVFHRIDDPNRLPIPEFLLKVARLSAYAGALRARFTPQPAGAASPADVPTGGTKALSAAGGDTPPEVVAQIKRQQFAARYQTDGSAITWDDNEVFREMVTL